MSQQYYMQGAKQLSDLDPKKIVISFIDSTYCFIMKSELALYCSFCETLHLTRVSGIWLECEEPSNTVVIVLEPGLFSRGCCW